MKALQLRCRKYYSAGNKAYLVLDIEDHEDVVCAVLEENKGIIKVTDAFYMNPAVVTTEKRKREIIYTIDRVIIKSGGIENFLKDIV